MCINSNAVAIARSHYQAAFRLVSVRETDPSIRRAMDDAIEDPRAETINAALAISHGKAWEPGLLHALAQVGIAAAADILGGRHG